MEFVLQNLDKTFKITHGDLGCYIGLKVTRSIDRGITLLHQMRYTHHILNRVGTQDCQSKSLHPQTERLANYHLVNTKRTTPIHVPYKEVVISFMCLSTLTRPDITYYVNTVAKYSGNPRVQYWIVVKRILRYLKGTASFGIVYSTNFSSHAIQGICDADFGGGIDTNLLIPHKLCVSTQGRFDLLEQLRPKVHCCFY